MRKEDLSKAIGDIDPKLVESSLAYRPAMSKHRLTKIVALAACLAVIVTAIPLALILNRENGNTEDLPTITDKDNTVIDKPEPDKEEPLVIFCSSPTELKQQLKADAKVEIKDVAERTYFDDPFSNTVVDKKAGTPYVKTITIGNETFEISYEESRASKTFESLSTHLKAYASVDKYSIEHTDGVYWGTLRFEFSQETGELTKYFKGPSFIKNGNLGEEELHQIAKQVFYDLYGLDVSSNPDYHYELRHHPATNGNNDEYYRISYRRYINGYETDEIISVGIDTAGQILSINQNLGLYDEIAETITAEKLEVTKNEFLDSISDPSEVQEKISLELDNFGKCSMVFKVKDYVQIRTIYVEIG